MTKDELKQWVAKAKLEDTRTDYDENGNCEETRIYSADGRFYRLDFANGYPYETWRDNGFVRGVYAEPQEVIRETKLVEVLIYRQKDEPDDIGEYFYRH